MFLYDFATKTAQKPDTVATYIRRNEKIFKNHVERREKQLWLDEKAVKILLKKYPEVQRKKYPWWKILNKGMTGIWIARRYWLYFSSMINLILVTFLPVLIGSNSIVISVNSLISDCAFSKTNLLKSGNLL